MAFFFLAPEAESLAYTIQEFECDTDNKRASRINLILQTLVDCVAAIELIGLHLLDVLKIKTKAAISASSRFYDSF